MILGTSHIDEKVRSGAIHIAPYNPEQLNPASYDLTLGDELCVYCMQGVDRTHEGRTVRSGYELPDAPFALDAKRENAFFRAKLSPEGFRLGSHCRRIFLLHTHEVIGPGRHHVAVVDGKSSLARLGLVVHATAGYVDPGFVGQITLEVSALGEEVVIYPGMRIAQVRFSPLEGYGSSYQATGNYVDNAACGPVPSRSYLQFSSERKTDPVPPPSERMTEAPPLGPILYACTRQNPCGTCVVCLA